MFELKEKNIGEFDVIVCGGGVAGVAAAIMAGRNGAKVLVIEKAGCLGGTLTDAFMPNILDSENKGGFVKEIYDFLNEHQMTCQRRGNKVDENGKRIPGCLVDTEGIKYFLDKECEKAGVTVLYNSMLISADHTNGHINKLLFATHCGNYTASAKVYIDATGNGALSDMAGCKWEYGDPDEGRISPASMSLCMGGFPDEFNGTDSHEAKTNYANMLKENDIEIEYMGHAEDRDITLPNEANIIITGSLEQDTLPISIGVEVEHRDDESGVNIKKCKWVYNTIAEAIGTDESLYTEEFNSNPQNMTLNIEEEGEYYLHILTVDNKGNKKETIKGPIAIIAQYHSHTGTTGQTIANGCYITPNTTTVTATCVVTRSNASYSSININKYTCPKCGNDQSGGLDSTKYYAYSHSGCGKATHYYGQGECDEEGCDYLYTAGKTASNHTYQKTTTVYELGCEKDETTVESYKVSY